MARISFIDNLSSCFFLDGLTVGHWLIEFRLTRNALAHDEQGLHPMARLVFAGWPFRDFSTLKFQATPPRDSSIGLLTWRLCRDGDGKWEFLNFQTDAHQQETNVSNGFSTEHSAFRVELISAPKMRIGDAVIVSIDLTGANRCLDDAKTHVDRFTIENRLFASRKFGDAHLKRDAIKLLMIDLSGCR